MGKNITITHQGKRLKVRYRASSGHYMMHWFNNKRQLLSVDIYHCIETDNLVLLNLKNSDGGELRGCGVSELITKEKYLDIVDKNKGPEHIINFHEKIIACFSSVD